MKMYTEPALFARYPNLTLAYMLLEDVDNTAIPGAAYSQQEQHAISCLQQRFTIETLKEHAAIRLWQDIYLVHGINPKKYVPTVESLVKRALKGGALPWISTIVNQYLLTELEYLIPIGGYDADRLEGNLHLRCSPGGEPFTNLQQHAELTEPGELIYADDNRVLTRKWNYRDTDVTQIKPESKNIILMAESPVTDTHADLINAMVSLKAKLQPFCGSEIRINYITHPVYNLPLSFNAQGRSGNLVNAVKSFVVY